jgi:hypothetical protein|tara:strand:- start:9546 stop:9941 length:396 start_codon:yes stop_codon:yes gene_type:complete
MEFVNKFISVERHVGSGEQPIYLMDYGGKYVYHTLTSPISSAESPEWSITDSGDKVRVPIFAYKSGKEPDSGLFGYGIQLGIEALELAKPTGHFPHHVVLVLGIECHDLAEAEEGEEAHRVYVGISFAREK